jgi:hypothetical protein
MKQKLSKIISRETTNEILSQAKHTRRMTLFREKNSGVQRVQRTFPTDNR